MSSETVAETPPRNKARIAIALLKAFAGWAIHLAVFMALVLVYIKGVPLFESTYRTYELDLPAPTILMLRLSYRAVAFWHIPFLFFFVGNAAVMLGLAFLPGGWRWLRRLWFDGFVLFAVFVLFWSFIAAAMPLVNLTGQAAPMPEQAAEQLEKPSS